MWAVRLQSVRPVGRSLGRADQSVWRLEHVNASSDWSDRPVGPTGRSTIVPYKRPVMLMLMCMCAVKLVKSMTPVERLASLLAAISHDLDHPGTNQSFLIATSNPLAPLYQVLIDCSSHFGHTCVVNINSINGSGSVGGGGSSSSSSCCCCCYIVVVAQIMSLSLLDVFQNKVLKFSLCQMLRFSVLLILF